MTVWAPLVVGALLGALATILVQLNRILEVCAR